MIYLSALILILYLTALIYGGICFLRKKMPLYFKLLFFAVACFFQEKLYFTVNYFCTGSWDNTFNFAIFGSGAAFAFMLSANYGQFDGIVDDGSKEYAKYRHIAVIAPIITGLISVMVAAHHIHMNHEWFFVVVILLVNLPGILASYFNMKLLIFPDVFMVKPLRACNAMGLIVIFASIISEFYFVIDAGLLNMIVELLCSVSLIIWMICARRGFKGWKT